MGVFCDSTVGQAALCHRSGCAAGALRMVSLGCEAAGIETLRHVAVDGEW